MVDTSMLDLFKVEVEQQCALLNDSLLALDENPTAPAPYTIDGSVYPPSALANPFPSPPLDFQITHHSVLTDHACYITLNKGDVKHRTIYKIFPHSSGSFRLSSAADVLFLQASSPQNYSQNQIQTLLANNYMFQIAPSFYDPFELEKPSDFEKDEWYLFLPNENSERVKLLEYKGSSTHNTFHFWWIWGSPPLSLEASLDKTTLNSILTSSQIYRVSWPLEEEEDDTNIFLEGGGISL